MKNILCTVSTNQYNPVFYSIQFRRNVGTDFMVDMVYTVDTTGVDTKFTSPKHCLYTQPGLIR